MVRPCWTARGTMEPERCHRSESQDCSVASCYLLASFRAAHRFFWPWDIRFRPAADTFRRPGLAAPRAPRFALLRPLGALMPELPDDFAVAASPRCFAHRAFWASEMRFRASGDMVRGPRLAAPRAVLAALAGESEPVIPASLPRRLAVQYFFIRSATALRWAAVMVRRRRVEWIVGSWPPSASDCLVLAPLEPFCRSSGKARRMCSSSTEISARRA